MITENLKLNKYKIAKQLTKILTFDFLILNLTKQSEGR